VKSDKEACNNQAARHCTVYRMRIAYLWLGLFFEPDDGSEIFLRNIGRLLPNYNPEYRALQVNRLIAKYLKYGKIVTNRIITYQFSH
jgi:hypothetical protein